MVSVTIKGDHPLWERPALPHACMPDCRLAAQRKLGFSKDFPHIICGIGQDQGQGYRLGGDSCSGPSLG